MIYNYCNICNKKYKNQIDIHAHLLFSHNILKPICSTDIDIIQHERRKNLKKKLTSNYYFYDKQKIYQELVVDLNDIETINYCKKQLHEALCEKSAFLIGFWDQILKNNINTFKNHG